MKSMQRAILCLSGVLFVTILFLLTVPVDREVSVVGWSYNTTRNTTNYIPLSADLTASLSPTRGVCERSALLLMMVCSAPWNFEARAAIRDTWGGTKTICGQNIEVYFLIGETSNSTMQADLQLESDQYGDIIQERFIDSYNNLTLKSIQMVKIATNHCLNTTKYLLKIDDDMYVNVPRLVSFLLAINDSRNVLIGKLICGAKPIKDPLSKWYSPKYMYKDRTYPNYLSGTGYLMSIDVAQKLFETSLTTPIFHLEDVYLTGICAKKANIKPHDNHMFTYRNIRSRNEMCEFRNIITLHHHTPENIRDTYKTLSNPNIDKLCSHYRPSINTRLWLLSNIPNNHTNYNRCV